jgi:hypothetical protein
MNGIITGPIDQPNVFPDQGKNQTYRINENKNTPLILLEEANNSLLIKGKSYPENPELFYSHLYVILHRYTKKNKRKLTVYFFLEYFNTGSAKCLYQVMVYLKEYQDKGIDIKVNWYYYMDDEGMHQSGENFSKYSQLDMTMIPVTVERD